MIVLDRLRKKRNLADYGGASIAEAEAAACVRAAEELASSVEQWLETNRPDLL